MNFIRSDRALLICLLLLSAFLKIPGSMSEDQFTNRDIVSHVVAFLRKSGLEASRSGTDEDLFMVSASTTKCEILIAALSPQGWHRHVIRRLVPEDGKLLFLYDGQIYQDQPVLLTRTRDYWNRFVRYAGGRALYQPVFGIIGSPECALDEIPWNELADTFRHDPIQQQSGS